MAKAVDEKIVETENTGLNQEGATVHKQTRRVESNADPKTTAYNLVWYIYGLIAILLLIRFILKLFGANAANGFVDFIYAVTGVLTAPFDNIFGVSATTTGQTQSVFEPSILVAIAVYGLIAWGISRLLTVNEPQ